MSSKKYGSQFLKGLTNYRVTPKDSSLAIEKYLESLDHPRALTVWLMFKHNEHKQLVELEFDPSHYNTIQCVRSAYSATKLLSKYKGLTLDYDLDEVALKKFDEFELLCKHTNSRFRNLSLDPLYKGPAVWLHNAVIRKIDTILGEYESSEIFSLPDWGPGASTLIKRRDASAAVKFQNETGITRDLYSLIPIDLMEICYPLWAQHLKEGENFPNYQIGNKVITVPKDAKTNRVIAIEPGINLWFQKALGDMIEDRLRGVGIDLRYQTRNQQLAKAGSKSGLLATVDLSSASDSISRLVVEALLPPSWFSLLDASRSHYGNLKDRTVKWEKFSSMGNGFTFPLESLIFYAVAKCCAEYIDSPHAVGAYGDDIIIPVSAFELFSEMMDFYGFRVNAKKSHFKGLFRESCGVHYYSGIDVKPVYLKDILSTAQSVYRFANAIRRMSHRWMNNLACDESLRPCFDHLVAKVPKAFRFRIPNSLGDGGFISNLDEATPVRAGSKKPTLGWEGWNVLHVQEIASSYQEDRIGYELAELWRLAKRDNLTVFRERRTSMLNQDTTLGWERRTTLQALSRLTELDSEGLGRNSVPLHRVRTKVARSVVKQWADLGPWL